MKKFFAVIMALAITLSLCACGGGGEKAESRLEQIKDRGYIEVCTEPYFAPMEFIDATKEGAEQYVGMDIEIAKYIADKLGVELRIVPLEFSAVLTGITAGKYDLALSALAYSPSRAESMNMSVSYYNDESIGYGFLVRQEDAGKYNSIEDLKDAVIVTQSGSVQKAIVDEQVPDRKELKLVSSMTDGFLSVKEGKADVCICETGSAGLYAEANGGLTVPEFKFVVDPEMTGTCVGIPLGEDELTEFVNSCIEELNASGKTAEWYEEYSDYARTLGID